jgi:hypothetical protein
MSQQTYHLNCRAHAWICVSCGAAGRYGFWMGFEHIGPFAGPRVAVPQGSRTKTAVSDTGEHEGPSHVEVGWATGSVGQRVWQLSCEAVGLPVDVVNEDNEKERANQKASKQNTKKQR